jgi:hypothetical protein
VVGMGARVSAWSPGSERSGRSHLARGARRCEKITLKGRPLWPPAGKHGGGPSNAVPKRGLFTLPVGVGYMMAPVSAL